MKSNIRKLKSGFTQIPNKLLRNNIISLKAKGLFCYLQSRPDDWQFSSVRMAKIIKEGIDSIQSGLKELEEHNYLERIKLANGRMIYSLRLPGKNKPNTVESHNGKPQDIYNKDNTKNKEDTNSILGKNKKTIQSLFDDEKVPAPDSDVFDWRWAMKDANSRTNLFFIGLFWKKKGFTFDNKDEAGAELVRLLRTSTKYAKKFPVEKFKDMLEWIEIDSNNKGNYEWGFDTLNKRLAIYNQEK